MRVSLGYRPEDIDVKEVKALPELFAIWSRGHFGVPLNLPRFGTHPSALLVHLQ